MKRRSDSEFPPECHLVPQMSHSIGPHRHPIALFVCKGNLGRIDKPRARRLVARTIWRYSVLIRYKSNFRGFRLKARPPQCEFAAKSTLQEDCANARIARQIGDEQPRNYGQTVTSRRVKRRFGLVENTTLRTSFPAFRCRRLLRSERCFKSGARRPRRRGPDRRRWDRVGKASARIHPGASSWREGRDAIRRF